MTATAAPSLEDHLREKLAGPRPVALKDLMACLPALKGKAKAAREVELKRLLDAAVVEGRAFSYQSGASGADRYWGRDEHEALGDALVAAADGPKSVPELKKATAKAFAKPFAKFVEGRIAELEKAGRLHRVAGKAVKYSGKKVEPLAAPKVVTKLNVVAKSLDALLKDTQVSANELFAAVRKLLKNAGPAESAEPAPPQTPAKHPPAAVDLPACILKLVTEAGAGSVLSLADVRAAMPEGHRGVEFDQAIIALAEQGKVRIYQDADPVALTPAERAQFVTDGGSVFRTIKRATL